MSGSIRDGVFDGEIVTEKDGVFYVERARRYFPQKLVNSSHHSVIYHERHVTLSPQEDKQGGTKGRNLVTRMPGVADRGQSVQRRRKLT